MVWGLFPVDPLPGEDNYYFYSKGTYKVGRKGCDVIINKDKGVSRIHAEIAMNCVGLPQKNTSNTSSEVRIRDCSKYGTFINKNVGSKQNVHEFPDNETTLKDGDLISFGTGNATYRFCHVPLIFLVCSVEPLQANQLLQGKISSIGACVASTSLECTHVLVEDFMSLTEEILDAVLAKKPLARCSWVEVIAEKNIRTDIPSCSSYSPTLVFEGVKFKVADPKSRENCLRGYTFLLESEEKYKFKEKLQLLLKVSGAKVVSVERFCPTSQGVEDEQNDHLVGVVPAGSTNNYGCFRNLSSVSRVSETDVISAALSGYLNPSVIVSPPVLVTSSCSTDETIIADSDAEMEMATSVHNSAAVCTIESIEKENKDEIAAHTLESAELHSKREMAFYRKESVEHNIKEDVAVQTMKSSVHDGKGESSSNHAADNRLEECHIKNLEDRSDKMMAKISKIDESETGNLDIIYSQALVVRETNLSASTCSFKNGAVVNFKRFRKIRTQSGNSFNNLVPFSKYPYKDSDYGNEEIEESIKEEKRRKQMEAVAEDLFNNEKGKCRGVAGSLRSLFAHS